MGWDDSTKAEIEVIGEKLKRPFEDKDLEWRVGRGGITNGKPWAMLLCYVTSRAVMERFDEALGFSRWQVSYRHEGNGVIARIGCRIDNGWVNKEDGADETQVEAYKGGISSALKRAAVPWGVGRYLYGLGETWADFCEKNDEDALSCQIKEKGTNKTHYLHFKKPMLNGKTSLEFDSKKEPTKYQPSKKDQVERIKDHIRNGDCNQEMRDAWKDDYKLSSTADLGKLEKKDLLAILDDIAAYVNDGGKNGA